MKKEEKNKIIANLEAEIQKLEDGKFKFMFFVFDSQGHPVSSLAYIYETAYQLSEMGYDVRMLYTESKKFEGVESWLGKKYADLKHHNVDKKENGLNISPSDILVVPDVYANVFLKTKELPCKHVILLQNFDYLTENMPISSTFGGLNVSDCITTSEQLARKMQHYFPNMAVSVVRPSIAECFTKPEHPKKMVVNIVAKNQSDFNSIVKPFYWKNPIYSWVSFRGLLNVSREDFAEALKEGCITVWLNPKTYFGYSALESMACGNIVVGKVPDMVPEWMTYEGEFADNGVWFSDTEDCVERLSSVIQTVLHGAVPKEFIENMEETVSNYTVDKQIEDIKNVYLQGIVEKHKKNLILTLSGVKNEKAEDE